MNNTQGRMSDKYIYSALVPHAKGFIKKKKKKKKKNTHTLQ